MESFIKSDTHITLMFSDGSTTTVNSTNENYASVCKAVKDKKWKLAKKLAQPIEAVKQSIKGINRVAIESGFVTYDGIPLHGTLVNRILEMYNSGFDISPMAIFLENLMSNPSYRAVNELYDFMEVSDLPITEDGHFIAYKRVRGDFTDIHSGKIDNSPGSFVEIPRNMVDDDKDHTCSSGLHFCARDYLSYYGARRGDMKVVMVKINPRDVVSIPSDYNNAKGRCCGYYVVKELEVDFDSDGNLPKDNLEGAFHDTSNYVKPAAVEQLDVDAILEGDPTAVAKVVGTYDSPTHAMHETEIDSSSIKKACDGDRLTAGGYGWRWVELKD